jgi:Flp pilus assembly protein CpaB
MAGSVSLYADVSARRSSAAATVPAAVVARDVRAGELLTEQDVGVARLPRGTTLEALALPPADVVGRSTTGDMQTGEMITTSRLVSDDETPPGFARMPVAFPGEDIGGFLVAGMRIDVVWTPDGFSGEAPQVIAEDVRIVKILDAEGPTGGTGSVTALVDVAEDDTVRLAAATRSGSLSVLLRRS